MGREMYCSSFQRRRHTAIGDEMCKAWEKFQLPGQLLGPPSGPRDGGNVRGRGDRARVVVVKVVLGDARHARRKTAAGPRPATDVAHWNWIGKVVSDSQKK